MKRTQRGLILLFIIVLAAFAVVMMCRRSSEGEKIDFTPEVATEAQADSAAADSTRHLRGDGASRDRRRYREVKSQKKRQRLAAPPTPASPLDTPM